ncbi:MAG: DNA (cytosine-5-)-methyltransferase [Schwartzia sp.]|nr:DNA (cytosine-5-)-methyltransferase [Schwartzia sp. (in: firmicutes)]
MRKITLGSLFDGIGGWQLAAKRAGVIPLWSSEIEPFPAAVTRIHFPTTMQLGDVTKIDGAKLPPVDIVCAGSPCQGLSVAGRQKGLQDERSGLFHRGIDIVHAMRRATGGKFPRWFIWENVPGCFSSNRGMDFKAVLESISQTELPMPYRRAWAKAGMVGGRGSICDIAWRTLDAQFFGVAQRRERVFLVADFRAGGRCADKVLFEWQSLSGNTDTGGAQGKGTAAGTESGIGETSGRAAHPINLQVATRHIALGRGTGFGVGNNGDPAYTLEAEHSHGVAVYDMTHADEVLRKVEGGKSNTLNARMGTGGNQVPIVFAIEGNGARPSHHGDGWSNDGKSFTLNTIERHAVVYGIGRDAFNQGQNAKFGITIEENKQPTILAKGAGAVFCVGNGQLDQARLQEKSGTLNCMHDQQCVMIKSWVRRYTPRECERLQGLPDDFTLIPDKTCSDAARYKALGNGMAQPCADFIIKRIAEVMRMEAAGNA